MLQFHRLHEEAIPPKRAYDDAAGYDLHALLLTESGQPSVSYVLPNTTKAIPTGLMLLAPRGHFIAICSRSGLAGHNPPIFVANAPGIIDPDYYGEVKVLLYNGGVHAYQVRHGERIAQLVINPLVTPELEEIYHQPEAEEFQRGTKGFGSTGL